MSEIDMVKLQREYDQVVAMVFRRNDAAFYGPLLCSLNFLWDFSVETAETDGKNLWWNPEDFYRCTMEERQATIMHELKHVAKGHNLRGEGRNSQTWNCACDFHINAELVEDGYKIEDSKMFIFDKQYTGKAEEQIYGMLPPMPPPPPNGGGGKPGSGPGPMGSKCNHAAMADKMNKPAMVANIVMAMEAAKIAGNPGAIPGNTKEMISEFLAPVIPWEVELKDWMSDLLDRDYTWARPNRRYPDMYLPSMVEEDGKLEELRYYLDVSGSISKKDIIRFNSELKYVWEMLRPKSLTVIQFDTRITKITEFKEGDEFDKIEVHGRGGTSLVEVRLDIIKTKPTAAIIFSDMHVAAMQPLGMDIPILWVVINNRGAKVPFGKMLHIKV